GQNIYSENSEDDFKEDSDKESNTINELSELEIFEFNENNYINM
ncbi:19437_t:CDS:1, partial [Funneliformis geosporum]